MGDKIRIFVEANNQKFLMICRTTLTVKELHRKIEKVYSKVYDERITIKYLTHEDYLIPKKYKVENAVLPSDKIKAHTESVKDLSKNKSVIAKNKSKFLSDRVEKNSAKQMKIALKKNSKNHLEKQFELPPDEPHKRIRIPNSDSSLDSDGVFEKE